MNTIKLTFKAEYAQDFEGLHNYYSEVEEDEESALLQVYVNDVEEELLEKLTDNELCEFAGLEPEHLLSINRHDYY